MGMTADAASYKTVRAPAEAELEEKRSVFIGYAAPVGSEEQALSLLAARRAAYPDARHHVYAYILRENHTARFSDDREPQGSAGMPVLEYLRRAELCDLLVVVTRYFGGILLGTGGLARAYTQAARMAVEAAGPVTRARLAEMSLTCSYSDYQKLLPLLSAVQLDDSAFGASVELRLSMPEPAEEAFVRQVTENCGGRVALAHTGERYDFI